MKSFLNQCGLLCALILFTISSTVAQKSATKARGINLSASPTTVAVVPLRYANQTSDSWQEHMPFYLQELLITYLSGVGNNWKIQDATQTNALLYKSGITPGNMRQYLPKEIAEAVDVEYVVTGTVLQEPESIRTVTSKRKHRNRGHDKHHHGRSSESRSHQSTVTVENFHTNVSIAIYDRDGQMIFNQSRHSILSDRDAYKAGLKYLAKRIPLNSKYH